MTANAQQRRELDKSWPDTSGSELRLLEFVEKLIIEAAQTDPDITQLHIARWLALAVVGSGRKVRR